MAASDIKKLLEAGIHTVEGLAHASKKALKDIKGLSEQKVEKLKAAGTSLSVARICPLSWPRSPFVSAVFTRRERVRPTGHKRPGGRVCFCSYGPTPWRACPKVLPHPELSKLLVKRQSLAPQTSPALPSPTFRVL